MKLISEGYEMKKNEIRNDLKTAAGICNANQEKIEKDIPHSRHNDKGELISGEKQLSDLKYSKNYFTGKRKNNDPSYSWLPPCSDGDGFFIKCKKEKIDYGRCFRRLPCKETESELISRQACKLEIGALIARYGHPSGQYASPYGTPYEQLSLPYLQETMEYHVYKVIKPITVECEIGTSAPAFGQPGFGIQFYFSNENGLRQYLGLYGKEKYLEEINYELLRITH